MSIEEKLLWEVLVPRFSNEGIEYEVAYHRKWDDEVRSISGGLTILRSAKGQWVNPRSGERHIEEMIPVRVYCTERQIEKIAEMTISHYDQEAVMIHVVSEKVKIIERR